MAAAAAVGWLARCQRVMPPPLPSRAITDAYNHKDLAAWTPFKRLHMDDGILDICYDYDLNYN
jgi:hypothetical protein